MWVRPRQLLEAYLSSLHSLPFRSAFSRYFQNYSSYSLFVQNDAYTTRPLANCLSLQPCVYLVHTSASFLPWQRKKPLL